MSTFVTPNAWHDAGTYFRYDGHRVFYRDGGDGGALLCIHGFPTASWDWHRLWPELTARFRVIAPDMIGFGCSDKPQTYRYTIHDQATLHEALLDHLHVDHVHVLAHDYGDTVTQELLARQQERRDRDTAGLRIRSACLLNGGIFPEAIRPRLIQKALLSPAGPVISRLITEPMFRRSFCAVFGDATRPSEEELRAFWALITFNDGVGVAHRIVRYLNERTTFRARWVGALRESRVPLRFIVGPADPVSGVHMADRYRELIPSPDVVLLDEHVGHYPQFEAPDDVLCEFLTFLEQTADSGG